MLANLQPISSSEHTFLALSDFVVVMLKYSDLNNYFCE